VIGDILQPTHLILILVVTLLVLGPKRLPEAGRSLGRGLREFRSALTLDDPDHKAPVPQAAGATVASVPSSLGMVPHSAIESGEPESIAGSTQIVQYRLDQR
jgi:sec-independent protein translocase protein TatA